MRMLQPSLSCLWLAATAAVVTVVAAQLGTDYIDAAPPTVYESNETSPQNAHYDAENNRFIARSVWCKDQLFHLYTFRRYSPATYPSRIAAGSVAFDIPLQKIYFVSTTRDLSGVVGSPIIPFHTADGLSYSDFVEINIVMVPLDYVADTYKSQADVINSGANITATKIIINMPVVPTRAKLQHITDQNRDAPIFPVLVWYKGVRVWTFVFEVTDQIAADYFAYTRGIPTDPDYGIVVTQFATSKMVFPMAMFQFDQYPARVALEIPSHGDADGGMRNIISNIPADDFYSPLWRIRWMTDLPPNYRADQVSNMADLTPENGFSHFTTDVFVNGPVMGSKSGGMTNPNKTDTFATAIPLNSDRTLVMGSHKSLMMQGLVPVLIRMPEGAQINSTLTNAMGAYQFQILSTAIPTGTKQVQVVAFGEVIRFVDVDSIVSDYVAVAPPTVYEEKDTVSLQNMDFDSINNRFPAHSGWYNNQVIHYYKFHVYSSGTDSSLIGAESTSWKVPVQYIYLVTTTGDMSGVVGSPIIQYHTSDGNNYSDYMRIHLVTAPGDYQVNLFKSEGDILASDAQVTMTEMVLNIPVVPTGSKLQDYKYKERDAPISPVLVWYKGVHVWTYVFEVTDQEAADYFAYTREDPRDSDYDITVTFFATQETVLSSVMWHLNQYTRGVSTDRGNAGGPSGEGMRNIISRYRSDVYSPLWALRWVTELPLDYTADQVSRRADMKANYGFQFVSTTLFMNGPLVGPVGRKNPNKAISFDKSIYLDLDSTWVMGSHESLIMKGGVTVTFESPLGIEIGSTTTNRMGAYEFEIMTVAIPTGTRQVHIVAFDKVLRILPVIPKTATGDDYIKAAPPTIYDMNGVLSLQNMDFDFTNNRFLARSGWYNDRMIHYYKFRTYTPTTYSGLITTESTSRDLPIQKIYFIFTTMTNSFGVNDIVGDPVIQYHTSDGNRYSDFMRVNLVRAPRGYKANFFKSEGDIKGSGAEIIPTSALLNIPVVPTGAKLQDFADNDKDAPISPVLVWYKGVVVWTYVFEASDQVFANYFAATRDNPNESDYDIKVTSSATGVRSVPMWHLNQFAQKDGGDLGGMRNVFFTGRSSWDYSPVWEVQWVTELPPNYRADQVSNVADLTPSRGFRYDSTAMFFNCPHVGRERITNLRKATDFDSSIRLDSESTWLRGSHTSLILRGFANITFETLRREVVIGSTETNWMGAYEYEMFSNDIPDGTSVIVVAEGPEKLIRSLAVTNSFMPTPAPQRNPATSKETYSNFRITLLVVACFIFLLGIVDAVALRRRYDL